MVVGTSQPTVCVEILNEEVVQLVVDELCFVPATATLIIIIIITESQ